MSVFSRRTVLTLLFLLVLVSVGLRYPLVEHERYQTDSYYVHYLAGSIETDGYAKWILHPLSYFGYYPYSYPSGIPFLLSEFSALSGLGVEASILVSNLMFGLLFCLGVFALVRQFIHRPEYVLLATFLTILGSRFVDTSYWDGSARVPMVVILVLMVLVLLRVVSAQDRRNLVLAALLGIGCFAVHHMAVMILLFALAYLLTVFQTDFLSMRFRNNSRRLAAAYVLFVSMSILVVSFGFIDFFGSLTVRNLQSSSLFNLDSTYVSVLLNIASSYTNQIGFVLPLAVIAIPYFFLKRRLSREFMFPVFLLVVFVPLLGNALYVSMVLSPFVAILGIMWMGEMFLHARRKKLVWSLLCLLVVSSLVLPVWSTQRWNNEQFLSGDRVEVDSQIFNDARYLADTHGNLFAVSNVNTISSRLSAVGGVGFLSGGIQLVVNGDVTPEDARNNVTWSSATFPTNLYKWFESVEEPAVDLYVRGLITNGVGYIQGPRRSVGAYQYFTTHSKIIVAVDQLWESEFVSVYAIQDANLPSELRDSETSAEISEPTECQFSSYLYYESERVSYYLVQLPI